MYDEASQVDLETLKIEGWPQILKIDPSSPLLYHATLTNGRLFLRWATLFFLLLVMLNRCNVATIRAFPSEVRCLYHEREVGYTLSKGRGQVTPTHTHANEQSWIIRWLSTSAGMVLSLSSKIRYKTKIK